MRTRLLNNIPRVAPSDTAAPVVLRRHKMERARRGVSFQKTDKRGGGGVGGLGLRGGRLLVWGDGNTKDMHR